MNKAVSSGLIIISILFIAFLIWGLIGAHQAQAIGVSCDMGAGNFCWQWHTNALGQIVQGLDKLSAK